MKCEVLLDSLDNFFEKHCPIKTITDKSLNKPWITSGILKSSSMKKKCYGLFMQTKDVEKYQRYKFYRDKINYLIKKSKIYFQLW